MPENTDLLREIRTRTKRCEYLRSRCVLMLACGNPEQAEAYRQRLDLHKTRILDLLQDLAGS